MTTRVVSTSQLLTDKYVLNIMPSSKSILSGVVMLNFVLRLIGHTGGIWLSSVPIIQ